MTMKRFAYALALVLAARGLRAQVAGDAAIRKILVDRIDGREAGVGIVVGVIEPEGRRVVSYGTFTKDDKRRVNGDTVFEIGSVTKVFTALLLADMAARGEVALADPVSKYLPPEVKAPKVTLEQLATHTSGLPRLPANMSPKDVENPYADYTVAQLYEFLATATPAADAKYDYSNLGAGLLGHALARRAGTDYETLVRTRILAPLGMKSTSITLDAAMKERFAPGHDAELKRAANWDLPTLAGAGALRSTANDMLTFLAAAIGLSKSPLAARTAPMLAQRRLIGAGHEVALGWHIETANGREIVWHNGGTGGYRTWVGFEPKSRTGVVVLSNASTGGGVDDIGRHLLVPALPLLPAPTLRKEIAVDSKLLDRYVGRYELAPDFVLNITRDENSLFIQATGQPRFEMFASGKHEFFLKVVDAQLTFELPAEGAATSVTLHQNGMSQPARRLEGEPPPPPPAPREVTVDPRLFDGYTGRYELAPAFVLTVTREGSQLFVQATGQPKFPVFPASEREFFYKVVEARITFVTDAAGRATSLVLHQNGADMPARRLE